MRLYESDLKLFEYYGFSYLKVVGLYTENALSFSLSKSNVLITKVKWQ